MRRELLKTAGPERLFWGSDWPFAAYEDKVTYADTVRDFFDWIPDPGRAAQNRRRDCVQVLLFLIARGQIVLADDQISVHNQW